MADTPATQTSGAVPDEFIENDLSCVSCGYNLRALGVDGNCPECGCAVLRTTDGDWLHYADRDWLRHIVRSLRFVVCGLIVLLVLFLAGAVMGGIAGVCEYAGIAPTPVWDWAAGVILFIILGALIFAPVTMVVGLYRLARPEPVAAPTRKLRLGMLRILTIIVLPVIIAGHIADVWRMQLESTPLIGVLTGVSAACLIVIWMHMALVARLALHLGTRCKAATPKRLRNLRAYQKNTMLILLPILVVLLMLWWLSPASSIKPPAGGLVPLVGTASGIWLLVMGMLWDTSRLVRSET